MSVQAQHWEELLNKAKEFHEKGNFAFSEQNYKVAKKYYHHCLLNAKAVLHIPTNHDIPGEPSSPVSPFPPPNGPEPSCSGSPSDPPPVPPPVSLHPLANEAKHIITACYNNLAAVIVNNASECRSEDFSRALDYCEKVLAAQPIDTTALHRKAVCLFHLREYERAIDTFRHCQEIQPSPDNEMMIDRCVKELEDMRTNRDPLGVLDRRNPGQRMPPLIPISAQNGHPPPIQNGAHEPDIELQNGPSVSGAPAAAAAAF